MQYSAVLDEWIDEKRKEIRESSSTSYLHVMDKHVKPQFGDYDVTEIDRKMIQSYIYDLGENLKRESILQITKVISQSFEYACENELITKSPWHKIKVPKDSGEKIINVFSSDEVNRILYSGRADQTKRDIVNLAYRTGMRIGEILTLKWADINFELRFLTVNRTLSGQRVAGQDKICAPKTKHSRRRIDLDIASMQMLERRFNESQYDYVFCKADGGLFSRQSMRDAFVRMCKAAGVEYRSLHMLRHTHATILLGSGVHPKIVQERLGHSSIVVTLDLYSHMIPGMQQTAVAVFNLL